MLIVVISDIHDNLANLDKCLDWCRRHHVAKMIFCGDTTTEDTLNHLAAGFLGEIFMVGGNIELYEPDRPAAYPNIDYRGEAGFAEIDGHRLGFCHEPHKIKKVQALAAAPLDFIFYGHTHKPWLEQKGPTTIANPGNLAGTFHQATFASLDTKTGRLDLRILAQL